MCEECMTAERISNDLGDGVCVVCECPIESRRRQLTVSLSVADAPSVRDLCLAPAVELRFDPLADDEAFFFLISRLIVSASVIG